MDIEWSAPPSVNPRGRPDKYKAVREELDKRPGEWAIVYRPVLKENGKKSSASSMRQHLNNRWGKGYEVVCRGGIVYARRIA